MIPDGRSNGCKEKAFLQAFVYLMTKGREGDRKSSLGRGCRRFGEGLGSGVELRVEDHGRAPRGFGGP